MKDNNYEIKLEKAIKDKYGDRAIVNPKQDWDDTKEQDYKEQKKDLDNKFSYFYYNSGSIEENKDFLVENRLFISCSIVERNCLDCGVYSFNNKDDIYLNKYGYCYKCYLKNEFAIRNKQCSIIKK